METRKLPQTCILASIYASSLYTNISHQEGKEAVIKNLTLNQDPPPRQPQPVVIGELTDMELRNRVCHAGFAGLSKVWYNSVGLKRSQMYCGW